MEIQKELEENSALLSVFRKEYYAESIIQMMKELEGKRICYVSLNKSFTAIDHVFHANKISLSSVFFIDAVSQGLGLPVENSNYKDAASKESKVVPDNVLFVSSPAALTELGIAIEEALKSNVFDVVVIDSLSTLDIYGLGERADKFSAYIIGKVKSEGKKGIFVCLSEDMNTSMIKNSCMVVDKVLEFESFYSALDNRKKTVAVSATVSVLAGIAFFAFYDFGTTVVSNNLFTAHAISVNSSFKLELGTILTLLGVMINIAVLAYKAVELLKPVKKEDIAKIRPAENVDADKFKHSADTKIFGWFAKNNQ